MYVELLDGRDVGRIRDIDDGTALQLVKLGRAKRAFGEPTQAAPIAAGGYRETSATPLIPPAPAIVVVEETTVNETVIVVEESPSRKKKGR